MHIELGAAEVVPSQLAGLARPLDLGMLYLQLAQALCIGESRFAVNRHILTNAGKENITSEQQCKLVR